MQQARQLSCFHLDVHGQVHPKTMTTIGKFRHLSRTSTAEGHFVVLAIDHRTNLLKKLNQFAPAPLADADFVTFKQSVIDALAPYSSAVLTDPAYGIAPGIATGTITGQTGLLAPIEVTDYGLHPSQRQVQFIPAWTVRKIKMMGGDGVKLLLPYHPEAANVLGKYDLVRQIVADCAAYDLPFFLEPIPYALDSDTALSNDELLQICVEMAATFSDMQVDVLKLPFPVDARQSDDESVWLAACQAVDRACQVPWALLSAGVDYATFARQSKIACQAGASGVIVGRAVWAEAVELQGHDRAAFLSDTAASRMRELADICAQYATPWHSIVNQPSTSLDWYEDYQA